MKGEIAHHLYVPKGSKGLSIAGFG